MTSDKKVRKMKYVTTKHTSVGRYLDSIVTVTTVGGIEKYYSAPKNISESELKLVIICKPLYDKYPFFKRWHDSCEAELRASTTQFRVHFNKEKDEVTIGTANEADIFLKWLQYVTFKKGIDLYSSNTILPEIQSEVSKEFMETTRIRLKQNYDEHWNCWKLGKVESLKYWENYEWEVVEAKKFDNVRKVETDTKTFINSLVTSITPVIRGASINLFDIFSYLFHRVAVGPVEGYSKEEYDARVKATREYLDVWLKRGTPHTILYIKFFIEAFEIGEWLNTFVKVVKKTDMTDYLSKIEVNETNLLLNKIEKDFEPKKD